MNAARTEKDKMVAGEPYDPADAALTADRQHAYALCLALTTADSDADRELILAELFRRPGPFGITPPFFFDYGYDVELGRNVWFNTGCVLLDTCRIVIGDFAKIGPGVHIYTVVHPMNPDERRTGAEWGKPVTIGRDVWIGGRAVVCPGVTIGEGSVIGAGSVVTRDIPARVFAAGNPARVVREL